VQQRVNLKKDTQSTRKPSLDKRNWSPMVMEY